jgi:pimeloyl-ACP methyl ester carboxylesterase
MLGMALGLSVLLCDCAAIGVGIDSGPSVLLPSTPAPVPSDRSGHVDANGVGIYYAVYGQGPAVILLHGGLANADYWGNQVRALAPRHTVIVMDSRGHGRSTRDARPYSYDLMADDVVALMDALKVRKTDVVGWSDGGTLGLDLAMRYPARVGKVFAFAATASPSGEKYSAIVNPTVVEYIKRTREEYLKYSQTPNDYATFFTDIVGLWASDPKWTDAQLQTIANPVLVVDGDRDEAIEREHTEHIAETIPGARLLLLPNSGHFALIQNPTLFNRAVLHFLGDR